MPDDLDNAFFNAWNWVWPKLQADPQELRRRLARRERPGLAKPLRAWCLAVRASDHRLAAAGAILDPPDGATLPNRVSLKKYQPHTVTLTARALRELCRPVTIPWPGLDWQHVAKLLGTHAACLYWGMKNGLFRVRYIPRLGGKWGYPVPVLYSERIFDPSSSSLRTPPDPVWGAVWQRLADNVPKDLRDTIRRLPVYYRYRLPFDSRFKRWVWECPACERLVRTVYYPMPLMTFPRFYGLDPEPQRAPARPARFACRECHRVQYLSRANVDSWNTVVSYLSGGLLYGSEVERPAWFTRDRRRAYAPKPGRAPSRRCEQVLPRVLEGWTYARIGKELGIAEGTVETYVRKICRQHALRTRKQLEARYRQMSACRTGGAAAAGHVEPKVEAEAA